MTNEPPEPQPDPAEPPRGRPQPAEPQPEPATGDGPDLLSIGLLVFFVSLLVIVAALLALPQILG
jgi:hypothetical protein